MPDTTLPVVLALIASLLAVAFVLYPLLRPARARLGQVQSDKPARQRAAIYREVLDLEFDCKTGKLLETDYREQSQALLARAASLLAQEQFADRDLDIRLEQEIAAARGALSRGDPRTAVAPSRRE